MERMDACECSQARGHEKRIGQRWQPRRRESAGADQETRESIFNLLLCRSRPLLTELSEVSLPGGAVRLGPLRQIRGANRVDSCKPRGESSSPAGPTHPRGSKTRPAACKG